MASNFTVFESAVSALTVNSQALSVAAQNIANVNTPGYSRQYTVLQSRTPQSTGGFELGRGVEVADIRRVYDTFTEIRLRLAQDGKANYDATAQSLQEIETLFNEIGKDGLAKYTAEFFNSFHDVANDPTSTSARLNLLNKATVMTDRFQSLAGKLEEAKEFIDGDIRNNITDINNLAQEIADLNLKIQAAGDGADLTFRDQRNNKVKELAQYVDLNVVDTSDGFQVYIAQGVQLVNGVYYGSLSTEPDVSNDNHLDVIFTFNSAESNITDRINGGALKGLLEARDTYISSYQDQLDEMAFELAQQVNDLHTNGYDLDGNTLREFFDDDVFTLDEAASSTLATDLKDGDGAHLRIKAGDVVTVTGTIGAGFSSTFTITSTTTLGDMATSLQAILRAAGAGTETVAVQADGSLRVTSGATAIANLQLTITGKTDFIAAFDYPTPIAAGGGTGDSDTLNISVADDAASLLSIDSLIDDTPDAIAASGSSANLPGGNDIAVSLAGLQNELVSFTSGSTTFASFYGNLLANIGSDSRSFKDRARFAADVSKQAEIQREQISGVSLEEEQLNLIKFQTAFQAASRLVSVASDILQRLVELGV